MRNMMRAEDAVEIIDALESADVDVWIYGGWGVDALLEEQTRSHDDLDVLIRTDDIDKAIRVTHELGFSMMTDELPQGFVVRDSLDRRIDFHPVRFRGDGSAVQEMTDGGCWVFSTRGMLGTGLIDGRTIRCLTPEEEALRATEQPGCAGYEPRAIDWQQMRLLRDRFGITLSYPFEDNP